MMLRRWGITALRWRTTVTLPRRFAAIPYICTTDLYDVHKVANLEKKVPRSWITEEGDYVTAEMKNYIEPLIQAELTPIMITGQPRHIIIDDLPDIK